MSYKMNIFSSDLCVANKYFVYNPKNSSIIKRQGCTKCSEHTFWIQIRLLQSGHGLQYFANLSASFWTKHSAVK